MMRFCAMITQESRATQRRPGDDYTIWADETVTFQTCKLLQVLSANGKIKVVRL